MKTELRKIGRNAFSCIKEMVDRLEAVGDRPGLVESAREAIEQDPLSLEVRSDWHAPNDGPGQEAEFCILLSTGGPATRIIGELERGEPSSARLEVQDWGTPWTEYLCDEETLLTYARVFYWGDG